MMHTYIALPVSLFFSHILNRLYFLLSNFPPTSDFMCKRNNSDSGLCDTGFSH